MSYIIIKDPEISSSPEVYPIILNPVSINHIHNQKQGIIYIFVGILDVNFHHEISNIYQIMIRMSWPF